MLSEEDVWVHQRGRSSLQLPVSRVQNVGEDRVMLLWVRQSERTEDIRPRDQHNVPQSQWRRHGRQCGGGSYQAEPWWGRQPEVLPEVLSAHLPGEVVTVWLTQVLHATPRRSVLRQTGGGQNTPGQGGQRQRGRLQEHDASEAGHQVRKHELSTVSSVWVSLSSGTARTISRRCCWTREQWRLLRCPRRFLLLTLTLLGWGECPGGSPLPEDESQSVGYECLKYVLCLVENLYNYFTDINLKYCIVVKTVSINKTGYFYLIKFLIIYQSVRVSVQLTWYFLFTFLSQTFKNSELFTTHLTFSTFHSTKIVPVWSRDVKKSPWK